MNILDLPIDSIIPAPWNPNEMDPEMLSRLRHSIQRFALVVPLVVRLVGDDVYETIGGAQRLSILRELLVESVYCVLVQANDADARLLGQALNHIAGSDNLGLRAEVLREVLASRTQQEVLAVLPETASSLQSLTSIGEQSLARTIQQREQTQKARLRHLSFQLTDDQLEVVDQVLQRLLPIAAQDDQSPNHRSTALYLLCLGFLDREHSIDASIQHEDRS